MKKIIFLGILLCLNIISYAQNINFPDANFKNALLNHAPVIDTDGDGEISIEEAENTITIDIKNVIIKRTTGLEYFENLVVLNIKGARLTGIDLSNNLNLARLDLSRNNLISVNVSNNLKLRFLNLSRNFLSQINVLQNLELRSLIVNGCFLTQVDVSQNLNLTVLTLGRNNISNIDISKNIDLRTLHLNSNNFTQIDISKHNDLIFLDLTDNAINSINTSQNGILRILRLAKNQLTNIDLSNNIELDDLNVSDNKLSELELRPCKIQRLNFERNTNLKSVYMTEQPINLDLLALQNCPSLEFICADQPLLSPIFELLKDANQASVQLSSDCDAPQNRITGRVTYDNESDGCDADDLPFNAEASFSLFSANTGMFTVFPNEEGEYAFFVPDGTDYLMTTNLARNYFTFFPTVVFNPVTSFFDIPADLGTITTDYCVQPVGDYNDLEISIIPLSRARPGFSATYKIEYKNVGTTTQSGNVTLDYQEDVLTYNSASPLQVSNTSGVLTWNFNNLQPLEKREIIVTLTLNTPTDSPALTGGEVLHYIAKVTSGVTDETEENNTAILNQDVVNSFDPNDKTCLEGNVLDLQEVGGYLHYLIRFENKGTAEAVNIRVRDEIDTGKLDLNTFVPLSASHLFTTTVTNNETIEFHFNDINLPFDDANNDGYVLFKIKTKDNLREGDEIVNSAGIYFDFNPPVITEDEIVIVKVEKEPEFSDYFKLFPNPTTGPLTLEVLDDSIYLQYMTLYDINGNFVGFFFANSDINISHLFPNTYFMRVVTNKGTFTKQIIKL